MFLKKILSCTCVHTNKPNQPYAVTVGTDGVSSDRALLEKTSAIFESLARKRSNPNFGPIFKKTASKQKIDLTLTPSSSGSELESRLGFKEVLDEYNTMNYEIRDW